MTFCWLKWSDFQKTVTDTDVTDVTKESELQDLQEEMIKSKWYKPKSYKT